MSKKSKQKKIPQPETKPFFLEIHWEKFVIALLLVLPLIYFSSFLSADRMIAGSDYLIGGYPFEKWISEQEAMPLWYPHVFGGIPVLGSPVGGHLAPLAQLREIIPPQVVLALSFIIFFFLAGLGTYLYLKAIGLSPHTAALGAVIYQFIGNLSTTPAAGHAGRAASIALFPLMLYFIHKAITSKRIVYFVLTALTTAFAFYEGHFQITYYGLLLILVYVIYYLIVSRKEHSGKDIAQIIGYGLVSVALICLLMAAIWLPVLAGLGEAARGVERGYEYATSWAMPPLELVDLIIPTFSGILDKYWGMNSFKIHVEYFGVIAVLFAAFAVALCWHKRYVKFFAFAAAAATLVAIGGATPFFRIPYALIPGFKLFRAPALIFYLASFSMVVLGAIGFEHIFMKKTETRPKKLFVIGSVLIAVLILVALIFSLGGDSLARSMQEGMKDRLLPLWGTQAVQAKLANLKNNYSSLVGGAWRTALFATICLGLLYLSTRRKIKAWVISLLLIALALTDQLTIVSRFLPEAPPPEKYYAADDVTRFIKEKPGVFRVFPTPWYEHASDLYLLYHDIQSAGGYIPNPLRRYQEFIGAGQSVMFTPSNLVEHPGFLDMLNAKYLIAPTLPDDISPYDAPTRALIEQIRTYLLRFQPAFRGRRYTVYENPHAIPRVLMVHEYQVHAESEALEIMKSATYDPWRTVLLEEDPGVPHVETGDDLIPGTVRLQEYAPNRIVCETESQHHGFVVLADNWHPDWQVFVDGEPSKIYIANHTFRAVYVPAGTHQLVFKYLSKGFETGSVISIFALILALGILLLRSRIRFGRLPFMMRRSRHNSNDT
ncbi:YfhO family protein [candidate division WOR-3 bacterium]|nr:YfhO family protein [candidate division WOR-3 bacterium]